MIKGKKIVALAGYRVYDAQVYSFVAELNKILVANNCALFVYTLNSEIGNSGDIMPEVEVFDLIPYDKIDVVVIMDEKIKSPEKVREIIDKASAHGVESIIIDGYYDNCSMVRFDYKFGFEQVVRHVIEDHHVKRPHFMAGKRNSEFSNERIEVFKQVIADNGIEYDDSMLSYGDFWSVPSRVATEKLLKREQLPEAVICANDIMAINVCDVFREAGIKVPEDVIVSGFDGIDEAFWSQPGITTAKCDSLVLADAVANTIFDVFKGQRNLERWISPTFIASDSCGCPRHSLDLLSAISGLNNRFYHHQDDIHIIQGYTSKIIGGESMEDALWHLRNPLTQHMCIVVEQACFDLEKNYFFDDVETGRKYVIYDSLRTDDGVSVYDPETIIPHYDEVMEAGYPLIFNCLEYMGKAPGFVCYYFPRYDIVDYSKTPSLTNFLGMALGGYAINKYQKFLREKLKNVYEHDALTGMLNRAAFRTKIEELQSNGKHEGDLITFFMADLNGLKQINDNLGHASGDQAIASVAAAMMASCPADALPVRFGGDEMMVCVFGHCNTQEIIERIDKFLVKQSEKLGYTVSASIGTYVTNFSRELDMHKIVISVDAEMYKIKRDRKRKQG